MKIEKGVLKEVKNRDLPKSGKITAKWKGWREVTNIGDDAFWGVCNGVGQNQLGNLLMRVRKELQL